MSTGRPSIYTDEIAETICIRIMCGESLREICSSSDMPGKSTVFRWLIQNESFRDQYTQAKEIQAEGMADEMLDISDNSSNDWMERHNKDGEFIGWAENRDAINRSRLMVDTRKWVAERLLPKKYGTKVHAEHSGPGGGPIKTASEIVFKPAAMDDDS